jgi:hypothetical protein
MRLEARFQVSIMRLGNPSDGFRRLGCYWLSGANPFVFW